MWYNKAHVKVLDPKQGYDLVVNEYKKYWSWLDDFYRIDFNSFLDRNKEKINIVDLWWWDGRLYQKLNKLNYEKYIACDISEKILKKYPGKIERVVCDLDSKFPFESDFFDLAVSFFVIEYLSDLDNFFLETYRVLKQWWKLIIWYFLQNREFLWKLNWESLKIKMYKHRIDDIKNIAENCFFNVSLIPIYEKTILSWYIVVCEKK